MAVRTAEVLITGNAKQAIAEIEKLSATATATSASMGAKFAAFGKGVALVGAATAVAVGAMSVKIADDYEKSHARLVTALKASGQSFKSWESGVQAATAQGQKFGFNASDIENALSRLVPATHNVAQANRDLGIAEDIAAKQHIDLESATQALVKVEGGRYLALSKTLGVSKAVIDGFKSTGDAIAYLQSHFAGQAQAAADTFGGKLKAMGAAAENVGIKIGQVLIPVLEQMITALSATVNWLEKHQAVAIALAAIVGGVLTAAMLTWIGTLVAAAAIGFVEFLASVVNAIILVIAALGAMSAAEAVATLGISLIIAGVVGLIAGLGKAGTSIDINTKAWSKLSATQQAEVIPALEKAQKITGDYSLTHQAFNKLLEESPGAATQFINALRANGENVSSFERQLSKSTEAHATAQRAENSHAAVLDYLTQGYQLDTAAILANIDALNKGNNTQFDAAKAVLQTNAAVRDLAAAAFASAGGTSDNAEANDKYTGSLISAKEAIDNQISAQKKAGESTADIIVGLQNVANTLSPGSPLRVFIEGYIQKLQETGQPQHAVITADASQAQAEIGAFIYSLNVAINKAQSKFTIFSGASVAAAPGSVPNAPLFHFAGGGVVPGAVGSPHLAVVHGGETVLTPGQRNGITINVTGSVVTEKELVRTVAEGLRRLNGRSGNQGL